MVRSAVFNSSPWIFCAKLGIIEPALSLFQHVYISLSVSKEILSKPDESASILKELQKNRQVDIFEARNVRLVNALHNRLGRGEAEAISIAIELDADVVTLDDYTARCEAARLGLEVKGTLGIIGKLIELKRFQYNIGELFENLKSMNFRVKDNIFWEIFKDIKQNQRS